MENGPRKYQVYKVRSGTQNMGFEYELKIAILLCLRNSSPEIKNMWLAVNVDKCGDFDDIVIHRETEKGMNTYLIQLKHEDKETDIKLEEFTKKNSNNKKSKFYSVKYFESISQFEDLINSANLPKQATETSEIQPLNSNTQTADTNTPIINLFQQNFDNIIYIIFTNRGTPTECDLLKEDNSNAEMLSHINTGGRIFQFDYEKLNLSLEKDFSDYNKKMFLFAHQICVKNLDLEIEKELGVLIRHLKITSPQISEVCQKFKNYIEEWSKGSIGGSYIITKTDILKMLTEILLTPYMVKMKEIKGQSEFELKMWKNLEKNYSTIFVDVNDFIEEFLKIYITTEVNTFLKDFKNKGILQKDPDDVKRRLLKVVTNLNENTFSDLAYEYQWKNNELPLLVKVKDAEELENVKNILRISQNVFRVIVLNKFTTDILHKNILGGSVVTLNDLTESDQKIVLECPVVLQGGRSAIKLSECLNKDIFQFVRVKEIIQIFTGKLCIGNKLEPLPGIFITRSLQCLYLRAEVLRNVENDKFVIKCDSMSSFEKFLKNHRLHIDSSLISSFKEIKTNSKVSAAPKIYIVEREEHIKEINKNNFSTNVHYLVLQNNDVIQWVKSVGTNKNIVPFLIKPDQYAFTNLKKTTYTTFVTESQIPKLISASPGMGKSVLIEYIALKTPENIWVLRINLSEHSEYYATEEFKNSHSDPSKHLINFNNRILNKAGNINDLSKKVFEKYLLSKKVLVLLDGFDETPVGCKDEVTKMIQSLNNFEYPLCITTRPVFKDDLERLLDTFAISINPFSKDDQINYLTEYFAKHINCSQTSESLIKAFVEKLLKLANKNLSKRDEGFTGIPLQTNLLAQVYEGHCKTFLNSNEFVDHHFDLLYLYKNFIQQKSEIFCNRYESKSCDVHYCSKKLRSFYSLKLLFAKEDLSPLNIDDYLEEMNYSMPNLIRYLQKDGIIALLNGLNASFIHRTFAEYLAAEWLAENINGRYKDRMKILIKKIFDPNFTIVRIFFDQILAQNCNLHLAIINHQVEKARNIITTTSAELSKIDKGGRTFLHLIAAWGVYHPAKYDIENSYNLAATAIKDDIFVILNLVPNEKLNGNNRDILLDYTSLDYALATNSLCIANYICAKVQNIDQRVFSITEDLNYNKRYVKKFYYGSLGSVAIMHNIVKDLNSLLQCNKKGDSGKTDLHWAVIGGLQEDVQHLLKSGVDVNAIDNNKMTALHYALIVTLNNQPEILTLLLSKGANVVIADVNGKTPLHYAVHYNQIKNLKLLLEHVKQDTSFEAFPRDTDGRTVRDYAAEKGHTKILALLLNRSANVNVGDNRGLTMLHWASMNDHIETVDFLIKNGADIEAKDEFQRTPLYCAVTQGQTRTVKFLLSKMADLRAKDAEGGIGFHRAAKFGHEETVRLLMSEEIDPEGTLITSKDNYGHTPLHYAITNGHIKIVELMVSMNKGNVDMNNQDNKGNAALHLAIVRGRTEMVKFLVSTKIADIERKTISGHTSLHFAAIFGHIDIFELLLSCGANEKSVTDINETVLHSACVGGNTHIIALLLYKGADLEARSNEEARTPLIVAVINGKIDAVKLLLDKGANIEAGDIDNETPLLYAIYHGHTAIAELFLSLGADIQPKVENNMTALHWACYRGRTDIAVLLLPRESDLERMDINNRTFLYCAASQGHADTVKLLLSKGANKTARNIEGLTPLDIAVKEGYEEVINLLLEE